MREEWRVIEELRTLWALTGRLSPHSFTRAPPTGRLAVLTPPPVAPDRDTSPPWTPSDPQKVLRILPNSGLFLILTDGERERGGGARKKRDGEREGERERGRE